jgi:hypothetical protein
MGEVWKPIPGAPGYFASSDGRVRSPRKILTPYRRPSGHTVVAVKGYGLKYVHFFVTLAFLGPRPKSFVIMHLDHCPENNTITNLQYGTVSENLRADIENGKRAYLFDKANHPARKIPVQTASFIRSSVLDVGLLAEIFSITPRHVRTIQSGVHCSI